MYLSGRIGDIYFDIKAYIFLPKSISLKYRRQINNGAEKLIRIVPLSFFPNKALDATCSVTLYIMRFAKVSSMLSTSSVAAIRSSAVIVL